MSSEDLDERERELDERRERLEEDWEELEQAKEEEQLRQKQYREKCEAEFEELKHQLQIAHQQKIAELQQEKQSWQTSTNMEKMQWESQKEGDIREMQNNHQLWEMEQLQKKDAWTRELNSLQAELNESFQGVQLQGKQLQDDYERKSEQLQRYEEQLSSEYEQRKAMLDEQHQKAEQHLQNKFEEWKKTLQMGLELERHSLQKELQVTRDGLTENRKRQEAELAEKKKNMRRAFLQHRERIERQQVEWEDCIQHEKYLLQLKKQETTCKLLKEKAELENAIKMLQQHQQTKIQTFRSKFANYKLSSNRRQQEQLKMSKAEMDSQYIQQSELNQSLYKKQQQKVIVLEAQCNLLELKMEDKNNELKKMGVKLRVQQDVEWKESSERQALVKEYTWDLWRKLGEFSVFNHADTKLWQRGDTIRTSIHDQIEKTMHQLTSIQYQVDEKKIEMEELQFQRETQRTSFEREIQRKQEGLKQREQQLEDAKEQWSNNMMMQKTKWDDDINKLKKREESLKNKISQRNLELETLEEQQIEQEKSLKELHDREEEVVQHSVYVQTENGNTVEFVATAQSSTPNEEDPRRDEAHTETPTATHTPPVNHIGEEEEREEIPQRGGSESGGRSSPSSLSVEEEHDEETDTESCDGGSTGTFPHPPSVDGTGVMSNNYNTNTNSKQSRKQTTVSRQQVKEIIDTYETHLQLLASKHYELQQQVEQDAIMRELFDILTHHCVLECGIIQGSEESEFNNIIAAEMMERHNHGSKFFSHNVQILTRKECSSRDQLALKERESRQQLMNAQKQYKRDVEKASKLAKVNKPLKRVSHLQKIRSKYDFSQMSGPPTPSHTETPATNILNHNNLNNSSFHSLNGNSRNSNSASSNPKRLLHREVTNHPVHSNNGPSNRCITPPPLAFKPATHVTPTKAAQQRKHANSVTHLHQPPPLKPPSNKLMDSLLAAATTGEAAEWAVMEAESPTALAMRM